MPFVFSYLFGSAADDAKGGNEDEDGYFGDQDTGGNGASRAMQLVTQSTRQSVELANSYTGAAGLLQQASARRGHREAEEGSEGSGGGGEGVGMVLNACTLHLEDMSHHVLQWGHGNKDNFDMDG